MTDTATKPIVWALCLEKPNTGPTEWGPGDEIWGAFTDDGKLICSHYCSSRGFGISDVAPTCPGKRDAYTSLVGTCDPAEIDYRVIPDGESLPAEVVERGVANGYMRGPKPRHGYERGDS